MTGSGPDRGTRRWLLQESRLGLIRLKGREERVGKDLIVGSAGLASLEFSLRAHLAGRSV
jgi:hypothetical protein